MNKKNYLIEILGLKLKSLANSVIISLYNVSLYSLATMKLSWIQRQQISSSAKDSIICSAIELSRN